MTAQRVRAAGGFHALEEYLHAELSRMKAEQRVIELASRESFARWAHQVLQGIAEAVGVSIGFLVGLAETAYEAWKDGFRKGLAKGKGYHA